MGPKKCDLKIFQVICFLHVATMHNLIHFKKIYKSISLLFFSILEIQENLQKG